MIARAKADTNDLRITYSIADLETIDWPQASFELVFSSLAFHYVRDFASLAGRIFQSLTPGGHLVFTIEHPIYMAAPGADWVGGKENDRSWPVRRFADEGERRTDWFTKGVVKYHRTLGTTLNTLIGVGFMLRRLDEWAPSPDQVRATPGLAEERDRPTFAMIAVQR